MQLHWCYDYNDGNPIPIAQIAEYQNYKTTPFNRPVTIKVYPRTSVSIYAGTFANSYMVGPRKSWIDINSPGASHYGLKFGVDNWAGSQTKSFKIRPFYYLSFKTTK